MSVVTQAVSSSRRWRIGEVRHSNVAGFPSSVVSSKYGPLGALP